MQIDALHAVGSIGYCIKDAETRLKRESGYGLKFAAWPQRWGNTACGFGGMAGQAMTEALTCVVFEHGHASSPAVVYHANQFAYLVEQTDDAFWEAVRKWQLPGKVDYKKKLKQATTASSPSGQAVVRVGKIDWA